VGRVRVPHYDVAIPGLEEAPKDAFHSCGQGLSSLAEEARSRGKDRSQGEWGRMIGNCLVEVFFVLTLNGSKFLLGSRVVCPGDKEISLPVPVSK
jgi:hypothetical protein